MQNRSGLSYYTLKGGIEISAATYASSGTMGSIVYHKETRKAMLLTNKHVARDDDAAEQVKKSVDLILQRAKWGVKPPCSPEALKKMEQGGLPIFQPAYMGGGHKNARVVAFVSSTSSVSDAALCELDDDESLEVGRPGLIVGSPDYCVRGVTEPKEGMLVMKSGKSTGVTWGVISAVAGEDMIIQHVYSFLPISGKSSPVTDDLDPLALGGSSKLANMTILQGAISEAGDSGAVWVEAETKKAVGLLYKGLSPVSHGKNYSVAKKMSTIMAKLKFDFY